MAAVEAGAIVEVAGEEGEGGSAVLVEDRAAAAEPGEAGEDLERQT